MKHSAPLAPRPLEVEISDTLDRGLADALIVSGTGTGQATDSGQVEAARRAAGGAAPVFVGSGVTAQTLPDYLPYADGFIIGSSYKRGGDARQPVDSARVREIMSRLG